MIMGGYKVLLLNIKIQKNKNFDCFAWGSGLAVFTYFIFGCILIGESIQINLIQTNITKNKSSR